MLTLLALLVPVAARAEPSERHNTVLVSVAAPAGETERLEAVTRELLSRLNVQVEVRRVVRIDVAEMRRALEPEKRYFARVWIALSSAGAARLYLEHGASDRVLIRDVAGDASNPELVREELGHILQTAIEGLQAGEDVGAPRGDALKDVAAEDPAAPAPGPAGPQESARSLEDADHLLHFGPRYELSWLGDGVRFEDGPGAIFEAAWPHGFELGAFYRRPLKVEDGPVGARLHTLSLRALATVSLYGRGPHRLRLGAGFGADIVRVRPVSSGAALELTEPTWRKLLLFRVQAAYAHRLFSFMALQVAAGVDLDFNGARYVVEQGSGERSVFDPWPVRPFIALGATVP